MRNLQREIQGKAEKLADGKTVCEDCYETSALIRECEGCEREFHAANLNKTEDGIYCEECIRETIQECMDFHTWVSWVEICKEDGDKATIEGWWEWHEEAWEDIPEKNINKRIMRKMLVEEMGKLEKAA